MTEEPKWKRFERLVYDIQRELAADAEVKTNDSIVGIVSKTKRQLDITIRERVGQYTLLIVLECKDQKAPVDVNDVEGFATKLKDVRANKGALVASSGFTETALKTAVHHGIDTFKLVDTESTDWKSYVSVPVLLERTFIRSFAFSVAGVAEGGRRIALADIFAPLRNALARKWNSHQIDLEPGERTVELGDDLVLPLRDGPLTVRASATVHVALEYYFGHHPVHLRGFKNEQDGSVVTKRFSIEDIEPWSIEQGLVKGWRKLDDPGALAVRPMIRLSYSDVVPTETPEGGEDKPSVRS